MSVVHPGDRVDAGAYVDVGGRPIWHFHGGDPCGVPTVLLHGAFAGAATWGAQIAGFLEAGLQVFVPERSGHGHSPDTGEAFSYSGMCAETIAYLETVVTGPANLVGWSDGSVLALLVARARPDLVNRMVLVGHHVNHAGLLADGVWERIVHRDPRVVDLLRSEYDQISPDGPDHFVEIYDKTVAMLTDEPDFEIASFASVTAPTLIVAPDRGIVRLEHALELANTLPHGRFATLPGSHVLPLECPELFNPLALSFLAADPPGEWRPWGSDPS